MTVDDRAVLAPETADAQVAARLFHGLSDATRLRLLLGLTGGEQRVTDLVRLVGTSQSNASGHLACLRDCGLVAVRAEGRQNFYRIATPEVLELVTAAERLLSTVGTAVALCPNLDVLEAADG